MHEVESVPPSLLCAGIKQLIGVLLIHKLGFIANDALTVLELADRGFK